ncbi:MAG TPA: FtsX-like permease family protein, partial [Blastocatellia bacterium]
LAFKPPIEIPLTLVLEADWRVLVFSFAVSFTTSMLFGLVPALQATKPELVPALKDVTMQSGYRRSWLRSGLVVAQISLSMVLLIAAGLVLRALQQVQTIDPGFEVKNGLMVSFDVGLQGYDQAKGEQFQRQVIERVESLPGVRSASLTTLFPLSLNYSSNGIYIEGAPPLKGANVPSAMVSTVGLKYFSTMNIPLLAGRDFTSQDTDKSPRVVIINEAFVSKFYPGLNSLDEAIGKRFRFGGESGQLLQIVGVARDGKYWTIGEDPQPFVYTSLLQSYESYNILVVRTETNPQAVVGAIRSEVQKLDPNLPLYDIKTIEEHMGVSLFPARVAATLLGSFGLLALLLAAIGIYGVTAYSVAQRTREMGIRRALGATPMMVFRLILRQGMKLALTGLGIGLGIAFALTRLMESVLYGVSATDPMAFFGVSVVLMLVILFACFIPARRATKVDPMIALRYE